MNNIKERKLYGQPMEGTTIPGDKYGFVDEHRVRMEAGITLVFALYSFISIVFFGYFTIPTIVIGMLWFDFIFKVFVQPKSIFFGKIAEILVNKLGYKKPYFVGAVQKRFAWEIGLVLSTFAFLCILIISGFLNSYGIATETYEMVISKPNMPGGAVPFSPPILACIICIIFMFFEAALGICVGCKMYKYLTKWGIIKRIPGQNCVNGACEIPKK